jgi:hydrogenase maturation protease
LKQVVIGVGNEFRRDDGFGIAVARELRKRALPGVVVLEQSGEGAVLMDALDQAGSAWIVDAARSGADPGTVHRLDTATDKVPSGFLNYSSHDFAVAEALEMARILGRLPDRTVVYGVEGAEFGEGPGLTEPVQARVQDLVDRLVEEINASICI